ncbi:MAG: hypothetical protein WC497_05760 [Patescibacteria group bacterium]
MACFLAPTTAAIILTRVRNKIPPRYHIEWLLTLLWGGVVWLIPEHIFHGEIVFYLPFFTAGLSNIIHEVLRVGVPMTLAAITVWTAMLALPSVFKRKTLQPRFVYLMVIGALLMVAVDRIVS